MDSIALQELLKDLPLSAARYYPSLGSTNEAALSWARRGDASALVAADEQTAGRGRSGRRWVTNPGGALAFSLLLRPTPQQAAGLPLYSPLAALALCQALEKEYRLQPQIKWPNDVLLERRKTAGILVEPTFLGASLTHLVVGVGINIAPSAVPPAAMLEYPATCIEAEAGIPVDRWQLLHRVLEGLFRWHEDLGTPQFLQAWEDRLAFRGEWVYIVNGAASSTPGKVIGVSPTGALRLEDEAGKVFTAAIGEVSVRFAPTPQKGSAGLEVEDGR